MSNEKNPFIKNEQQKDFPLIRFAVHSDSFTQDILNHAQNFKSLLALEKTPCFEVYFTDTENEDLLKILQDSKAKILTKDWGAEVSWFNGEQEYKVRPLKIKYLEQELNFFDKPFPTFPSFYNSPIAKDSLVKLFHLRSGQHKIFDYFIVGDEDPFWARNSLRIFQDIKIKDALELARSFLIENNVFYSYYEKSPQGTFSFKAFKPNYYQELCARSFETPIECKYLVRILSNQGVDEPLISHYYNGIGLIESLCQCADKVKLSLFKNDEFDVPYHLNYLLLLCASLIDNLALLIRAFYNQHGLPDPHKEAFKIGLRKSNNNQAELLKKLPTLNHQLFQIISRKQKLIELVHSCRDSVIHREKMQAGLDGHEIFMSVLSTPLNKGLQKLEFQNWAQEWSIEFSQDFFKRTKYSSRTLPAGMMIHKMSANVDESGCGLVEESKYKDCYVIENPLIFTVKLFDEIRDLYNKVMFSIPWQMFQTTHFTELELQNAFIKCEFFAKKQEEKRNSRNWEKWQTEDIYFSNHGVPIK